MAPRSRKPPADAPPTPPPDGAPNGAAAPLGYYDGKPVMGMLIKVTNAGDGLSKSTSIDPVELHAGEVHYVLHEVRVGKPSYPLVEVDDTVVGFRLEHTLKAMTGMMIDPELARPMIAAQRARLEEAAGKQRLPGEVAAATDGKTDKAGKARRGATVTQLHPDAPPPEPTHDEE